MNSKIWFGFVMCLVFGCQPKSSDNPEGEDVSETVVSSGAVSENAAVVSPEPGQWVSECVASHERYHQSEQMVFTIGEEDTYSLAVYGYSDDTCTAEEILFSIVSSGEFAPSPEEAPIDFLANSVVFTALNDVKKDFWNGVFNGVPLCEGIEFLYGVPVQLVGKECAYEEYFYFYLPVQGNQWWHDHNFDQDVISIKSDHILTLNNFSFDKSHNYESDEIEFALNTEFKFVDASQAYVSVADIGAEIDGVWTGCDSDSGHTLTLSFDNGGGTFEQTSEFSFECGDPPIFVVRAVGTYQILEPVENIAEAHQINYTATDKLLTVKDPFYLDYFNGVFGDPICADLNFTLDVETSMMGKQCDEDYAVTVVDTHFDMFAYRDGQFVDSQPIDEFDGKTEETRVRHLNSEMRLDRQ